MRQNVSISFFVLLALSCFWLNQPIHSMDSIRQTAPEEQKSAATTIEKTNVRIEIGSGFNGVVVYQGSSEHRFSNQYETAELLQTHFTGFWFLLFEGNVGTGSFERIGVFINDSTGRIGPYVLFEGRHSGFLSGELESRAILVSYQLSFEGGSICENEGREVAIRLRVLEDEREVLSQHADGCLSSRGLAVSQNDSLLKEVVNRSVLECDRSETTIDSTPPCFGANEAIYELVMKQMEWKRHGSQLGTL